MLTVVGIDLSRPLGNPMIAMSEVQLQSLYHLKILLPDDYLSQRNSSLYPVSHYIFPVPYLNSPYTLRQHPFSTVNLEYMVCYSLVGPVQILLLPLLNYYIFGLFRVRLPYLYLHKWYNFVFWIL